MVITIGRAATCDLRVDAPEVSGRHARVSWAGGEWVLDDLDSLNGTVVDGRPAGRAVLRDGSLIELAGSDGGPRLHCAVRTRDRPAAPATPAATSSTPAQAPTAAQTPQGTSANVAVETVHRRSSRPSPGSAAPPQTRTLIGRDEDCRHRIVDDLLVSRHHASLEMRVDGSSSIRDLGSANGTFVDGARVEQERVILPGQRVTVGNTVFRFDGTDLRRVELGGDVVFAAEHLTVETNGIRRLDDVSFWLSERSFLAVLGTSGSGKSTLLKAITGMEPATSGAVLYDGTDLYAHYGELRQRIGYVPQDDVLHPQLTVGQTLRYAATLRFSPDVTATERDARVREVLAELGLSDRHDLAVSKLSGGQRKRLSVGLELLTRPSLLILDEPTSGLDPGNERSVMRLLRDLADGGRTVIVVTHSTESLHLCDRVLFLARGGITTFFGPPMALPDHAGCRDFAEAFQLADLHPDPAHLRSLYRASPFARELQASIGLGAARASPLRAAAPAAPSPGGQVLLFARRYVRTLVNDPRSLLVLGLQAPVIALLMLAVFGSGHLRPPRQAGIAPEAGNVLMALVLAAIYVGASNAVREIVKERSILRREQNFGISAGAYLASKALVLGVITVAQSVVLVVVGTARQDGPTDALVLANGRLELIVGVSLCGLSAMALGLLISAVVSTPDKATTVLPVVLFAQFLLAGMVFPVDQPGLQQLSWATSSYWGLSAVASTADFPSLRGCRTGAPTPTSVPQGTASTERPTCPGSWDHDPAAWLANAAVLFTLALTYLGGAWFVLVRGDPAALLIRRRAPAPR